MLCIPKKSIDMHNTFYPDNRFVPASPSLAPNTCGFSTTNIGIEYAIDEINYVLATLSDRQKLEKIYSLFANDNMTPEKFDTIIKGILIEIVRYCNNYKLHIIGYLFISSGLNIDVKAISMHNDNTVLIISVDFDINSFLCDSNAINDFKEYREKLISENKQ